MELPGLCLLLSDLPPQDWTWRLCSRLLQGWKSQHAALRGLLLPPLWDGNHRHELLSSEGRGHHQNEKTEEQTL